METVTDFRKLDNKIAFFRQFPQVVLQVAKDTAAEPPTLLSQLKVKPPPRSGKWGGWSPDKRKNMRAQRKWFAMIRSGEVKTDGSHYIRTDKLINGYRVDVFVRGAEVLLEVKNTADRKRHLYTKGRRQIPGHAATGWQRDDPIVRSYLVGFRQRYARRLNTRMRTMTAQA